MARIVERRGRKALIGALVVAAGATLGSTAIQAWLSPADLSVMGAVVRFAIFGIVYLLGTFVLMQFGPARTASGAARPVGNRSTAELAFDVDTDRLFRAFTVALPAAGMSVEVVDAEQGVIRAGMGMGWRTWGERIDVAVTSVEPGRSTAVVRSSLKFGLIDWGKNHANIEAVEAAVEAALAAPATSVEL